MLVTGHTGFKGAGWRSGSRRWAPRSPGSPPACRPTRRCSSWPRVGERRARRCAATSATRRRCARAVARARPRSSSTWPRSRSCARSYRRPARDLRGQRHGHGQRARGRARAPTACASVVNVTSDKCYENREWEWAYREDEPLGGHDPYSSSKGASELVTARLPALVLLRPGRAAARVGARRQRDRRRRLGRGPAGPRRRARARWPASRSRVRNPGATRPWQHVLDPLSGYLRARAGAVGRPGARRRPGTSARPRTTRGPVALDRRAARRAAGPAALRVGATTPGPHPHEARYLKVDSSRARARLGWAPALGPRRERSTRSSTGTRRCATARTCAPSRSRQIERVRGALAARAAMTVALPLLRRAARGRLRRPRHVAAGELLPDARAAPTRWSRSIRCTRSSATRCFLVQLEEFESPERDLLRLRLLLVVLATLARARAPLRRRR